jgi:hypothetical protein
MVEIIIIIIHHQHDNYADNKHYQYDIKSSHFLSGKRIPMISTTIIAAIKINAISISQN